MTNKIPALGVGSHIYVTSPVFMIASHEPVHIKILYTSIGLLLKIICTIQKIEIYLATMFGAGYKKLTLSPGCGPHDPRYRP